MIHPFRFLSSVLSLNKTSNTFSESNGHYERVPIRVGDFALVENSEDYVEYQTTSREFCENGPTLTIKINNSDNGWSVDVTHGCYHWTITPSVDLHKERLARRRAFWHAGQYMRGQDLSHKERFSITYQAHEENPDVFDADAYFKRGNAITSDPFGAFLD